MLPLVIGAVLCLVLAALVVTGTERAARRNPHDLDPRDARFGRPLMPKSHSVRFARVFRWWAWAGALLVALGGVWLLVFGRNLGQVDIALTLAGSGVLAWILGGGLGIVKAYDRPE